jgi:predicted house-cleaning noncanonical NTP pyrophosphatase (MazG superfamily)
MDTSRDEINTLIKNIDKLLKTTNGSQHNDINDIHELQILLNKILKLGGETGIKDEVYRIKFYLLNTLSYILDCQSNTHHDKTECNYNSNKRNQINEVQKIVRLYSNLQVTKYDIVKIDEDLQKIFPELPVSIPSHPQIIYSQGARGGGGSSIETNNSNLLKEEFVNNNIKLKIEELSDNKVTTSDDINSEIIGLSNTLSDIIDEDIAISDPQLNSGHIRQLHNYKEFNSKMLYILEKLASVFTKGKIRDLLYLIKKVQLELLHLMLFISNCLNTLNVYKYNYCYDNSIAFSNNIEKVDDIIELINGIHTNVDDSGNYSIENIRDIKKIMTTCIKTLRQISIGINQDNKRNMPTIENKSDYPVLTRQQLQLNVPSDEDIITSNISETDANSIGSEAKVDNYSTLSGTSHRSDWRTIPSLDSTERSLSSHRSDWRTIPSLDSNTDTSLSSHKSYLRTIPSLDSNTDRSLSSHRSDSLSVPSLDERSLSSRRSDSLSVPSLDSTERSLSSHRSDLLNVPRGNSIVSEETLSSSVFGETTDIINTYKLKLSSYINEIITMFVELKRQIREGKEPTRKPDIIIGKVLDIDEVRKFTIGNIDIFIRLLEKLNSNLEEIIDYERLSTLNDLLDKILKMIVLIINAEKIDYTVFASDLNSYYLITYNFLKSILVEEFPSNIYQSNDNMREVEEKMGGRITYKTKQKSRRTKSLRSKRQRTPRKKRN